MNTRVRFLVLPLLVAACLGLTGTAADTKDAAKAKKALQDLGEFIGTWNATGEQKVNGKATLWKETQTWGWRFKGTDSWLAVEIKDGKFFKSGELRYNVGKKAYELTATDNDNKASLFTGELKRGKLSLEAKDEKTGDNRRLSINTAAEGIRLIVQYDLQEGGKGIYETVYKMAGNKDGESLAGGGSKKPECIVTGGTGTMTVSYMGKTFYVCCSGCRDEFNDNPKKYVDAFEKKK